MNPEEGPPEMTDDCLFCGIVAADEGFTDYRLVFNTGPDAGQTVFHAHLHLLAGRLGHSASA
jgi:histidine triad (HIT) family protein